MPFCLELGYRRAFCFLVPQFYFSKVLFLKVKTACSLLQLLGAGCLMVVVWFTPPVTQVEMAAMIFWIIYLMAIV
jgi:hypothetical protein